MTNTNVQAAEMTIISKLSIAAIGAKPKEAIKQEKPVALAHIYGRATDVKQFENKQDGTVGYALLGNFEAVALQTGEVFRSGKCFLPSSVHNMVVAQLQGDNASEAVDFAFEVWAKPSESAPIGYEYAVKPLIKPSTADPLEQMRLQIAERAKALPAAPAAKEEKTEATKAGKNK